MHAAARWLRSAGLLLIGIGFLGCTESEPEVDVAEKLPFAHQTVTVRVPAGPGLPERLELIVDEWSNRTGATGQIEEYRAGQPLEAEDAGRPEVVFFPITELAARAADGGLLAIPSELRSEANLAWLDVFQGLRERVCSIERQPTVVPLSSPVLVCYYRRDLLERAGLSPPRTWADYQQLVETLDEWAPGLSVAEPWGEAWRATMFLSRAAGYAKHPQQFSFFFDIDTGEPLVATPGFVRALEVSQSILARLPEQVRGYGPDDCRRELVAGRAALAIAFETGPQEAPVPFGPTVDGSSGPPPADRPARPDDLAAGFVRLPGADQVYSLTTRTWTAPQNEGANRATLTGFAGFCAGVSPGAGQSSPEGRQAAWNLLTVLTAEQRDTAIPPELLSPCRQSQLPEAGQWVGPALVASEAEQYVQAVAASLHDTNLVAELPVIGRERFRQALTKALTGVLSGEQTPQAALEQTASKWQEIAAELGRIRVLNSYRQSLGLRPVSER